MNETPQRAKSVGTTLGYIVYIRPIAGGAYAELGRGAGALSYGVLCGPRLVYAVANERQTGSLINRRQLRHTVNNILWL